MTSLVTEHEIRLTSLMTSVLTPQSILDDITYLILSAGLPMRIGFSLSLTKKAPSGSVFNMLPALSRDNRPTYLNNM